MLIFDAHLDLSMNALNWNRDLTRSVAEVRRREQGLTDKPDRGRGTVTLPEMRRGQVGICVATQIAHCVEQSNPALTAWNTPEAAWAHSQGQLAWYRVMEEAGEMVQVSDLESLDEHVQRWAKSGEEDPPVGFILSLEGADSILTLPYLERAYEYGLRALGPAHFGEGRYAAGTGREEGLTAAGRELVKEMDRLGIILDVTHLTDRGFWEALDLHRGPVWASHNNCRALVPHQRQLNDEQIRALLDRGGVIGTVLDAWMLEPGWIRHQSTPAGTGLKMEQPVDHIDHICQLAGTARHCMIGSDLDGGFGRNQTPADLDTIADLQKLGPILAGRGYSQEDVEGIFHGNLLRFLHRAWAPR